MVYRILECCCRLDIQKVFAVLELTSVYGWHLQYYLANHIKLSITCPWSSALTPRLLKLLKSSLEAIYLRMVETMLLSSLKGLDLAGFANLTPTDLDILRSKGLYTNAFMLQGTLSVNKAVIQDVTGLVNKYMFLTSVRKFI